MSKLNKLWKDAGFANIGLAIAALIILVLLGGTELGRIGFFSCLSACIALNWQAIMQKTTLDEDIVEIVEKVKDEAEAQREKYEKLLEEKIVELKKIIIGLKD